MKIENLRVYATDMVVGGTVLHTDDNQSNNIEGYSKNLIVDDKAGELTSVVKVRSHTLNIDTTFPMTPDGSKTEYIGTEIPGYLQDAGVKSVTVYKANK